MWIRIDFLPVRRSPYPAVTFANQKCLVFEAALPLWGARGPAPIPQVRQTEQLQEAAQRERTQREIHTQRLNTIALLIGLPALGLTFVSTVAEADSWRLAVAGSVIPLLPGVLFLARLRRGSRASTTEPRPAAALRLTPNRYTDEEADSRSQTPSI